jgi:hypothetical protein
VSTQIKGLAISRVEGAMVTDDGSNMLLKLQQSGGTELVLAFPAEQIGNLIQLAAQSATGARAAQGADPAVRESFVVEGWDVGLGSEDRAVVLTLKLRGGAELSFMLPQGVQQPLIDKLAATVAPPPADASQLN